MTKFNQRDQNVDTQYNAGKDQFIQNIVLVGQFLDFAKVEGLIPKPSSPSDFQSIAAAFEHAFDKRLGGDLAQATSTAGDILRQSIVKWMPKDPFSALPLREVLTRLPVDLYQNMKKRHLWNAFFEKRPYREFVRLYSLEILWKKYSGRNRIFGIACHNDYGDSDHTYIFCDKPGLFYYISVFLENFFHQKHSYDLDFNRLIVESVTYTEFRILIAGIVIDLIRLSSISATDVKFWQDIAGLLQIQKTG